MEHVKTEVVVGVSVGDEDGGERFPSRYDPVGEVGTTY